VLFRIAAGGMAEVFAARMVGEGGFEKPVAVKRMLPTLAEDERFVQMFLDEGRLAAHIASPHVVQTLDLGRAEDDSLYLVMELVVGVSLSALIRAVLKNRLPFPAPVAVDILAQAAEGLHDAHEARTMYGQPLQIVHRDVSPQNILVDVTGRVRITDFGVARALERATHTQSGEVKGKIGYFAPEQVRGGAIDRRTDVFALGIVAWETLAGKRLFSGDNPAQTLDMVMNMPVPRLDALRPDVSKELADAVERALVRDPAGRTASAGDFADELRRSTRRAGAAGVGELVRAHGGESLMKLEDGLRSQSPSSASRVRKSGGSTAGQVAAPAPAAASPPAVAVAEAPRAEVRTRSEPPIDVDEEPTAQAGPDALAAMMAPGPLAATRPDRPMPQAFPQPPTELHALPAEPGPPAASPWEPPVALEPAELVEGTETGGQRRWVALAVGALLVGVAIAASIGWWASGEDDTVAGTTGTFGAPTAPTPTPTAPTPTALTPTPSTPSATPPSTSPTPPATSRVGAPPSTSSTGPGTSTTGGTSPGPSTASTPPTTSSSHSTPATSGARRPRPEGSPAVRLATPRTTPETTPRTETPETTMRTEPRPEPTGRTGLVGVSDFEREIQ
jgi:serine/threonine-protein kinase